MIPASRERGTCTHGVPGSREGDMLLYKYILVLAYSTVGERCVRWPFLVGQRNLPRSQPPPPTMYILTAMGGGGGSAYIFYAYLFRCRARGERERERERERESSKRPSRELRREREREF